jgi:putative two-component system response regulator
MTPIDPSPAARPTTAPSHILFVDDEPRVLDSIRRTMRGASADWRFSFAGSVDDALALVGAGGVDVVVTDLDMPGRNGFELLRALAADPGSRHLPVLVLTGNAEFDLKRRALEAGAFDLVSKPISREDLVARLVSVLRTKRYADELASLNATLERKVRDRTRDLERSRTDILLCLAMAGECRDDDTGRHLVRVAHYSRAIAREVGLPAAEVEGIFLASPLHDIGKLGIGDDILRKAGPLTEPERATMQGHCRIGHRILTCRAVVAGELEDPGHAPPESANPLLDDAAVIALNHHERWDGAGYPNRIAGEAIPLRARIVAVADVYDALTTRRSYKEAMPHAVAARIIAEGAGSHFDPAVAGAFASICPLLDAIRSRWTDRDDDDGAVPAAESLSAGLPQRVAA